MTTQVLEPKDHIWVPLDTSDLRRALSLVTTLKDYVGIFKVGTQLLTHVLGITGSVRTPYDMALAALRDWRELVQLLDGDFFFDGKWMDVGEPTLKETALAAQMLDPKYVDFHVPTGEKGAAQVILNSPKSKKLGVTVLTSISNDECKSIFGDYSIPKVLQFAGLLVEQKADGLVCSPLELKALREEGLLEKLEADTPGIRPAGKEAVGQTRFTTPFEAIRDGASNLIIGSPITGDPDPVESAKRIAGEIEKALRAL